MENQTSQAKVHMLDALDSKSAAEALASSTMRAKDEATRKLLQKCARLAAEVDSERCQSREWKARAEAVRWQSQGAYEGALKAATLHSPGIHLSKAVKPPFLLGSPPYKGLLGKSASQSGDPSNGAGRHDVGTQAGEPASATAAWESPRKLCHEHSAIDNCEDCLKRTDSLSICVG